MKHLYPAQRFNFFSFSLYAVLACACLFSAHISYAQQASFTSASVQLVSFSAQSNASGKVVLSVVTESEINFSHFVVQRSVDGVNFDDAAIIFAEEENSKSQPRYYFFSDNPETKSATLYYRLKMVNVKDEYAFSDTVVFNSLMSGMYANISPKQDKLKISIPENWSGKTVNYLIYNTNQRIIKQEVISHATQTETLNITDLPTGRYIIRVVNGNDSSEQKIVKLNSYS